MSAADKRGRGRPDAYLNAKGEKVVGVTTVTGRYGDKGALINWAYKQGKAGVPLYASRDRAADIGSAVHDAIESYVHGDRGEVDFSELADDSMRENAREAFASFLRWYRAYSVEIVATELPLISEAYQFGGTVDAIARIANSLSVLDWKTSSGIYSSMLVQVSAYGILWEENRPGQTIEEYHVLRIGKESGAFEHRGWTAARFGVAREAFIRQRAAYELDAPVALLLK